MKIIFLDIDGVLNSEDWYRKRHEEAPQHEQSAQYPFYEFDPELVSNLNLIIQKTEAKVVVSSTWRIGREIADLQAILESVGFIGEVIDKTKSFYLKGESYTIPRGCEIAEWLDNRGNYRRINWSKEKQRECIEKALAKNYIILDDDSDMLLKQREHFVHTTWKSGLSLELAEKAIGILNSDPVDLYYGDK